MIIGPLMKIFIKEYFSDYFYSKIYIETTDVTLKVQVIQIKDQISY